MAFGLDKNMFEKDIKKIPGSKYIVQTLSELETKTGKKFLPHFTLSLWMATFLPGKNLRRELILPNNPSIEASYYLCFNPSSSYKLKDSLLIRIADCPQSFLGILDHRKIGHITNDLGKVYDGKRIRRIKENLRVPSRDFNLCKSFAAKPIEKNFNIIYPKNGLNIAKGFEEVLKKYSVLDLLSKKGYHHIYCDVEQEINDFLTLT